MNVYAISRPSERSDGRLKDWNHRELVSAPVFKSGALAKARRD
jgi:hypothetical protein